MAHWVYVDGRVIDVAEEVKRILAEDKPMTIGSLRRSSYKALKITCSRCGYENTVRICDIPMGRKEDWPLKERRYRHGKCPARGAGLVRVTPV